MDLNLINIDTQPDRMTKFKNHLINDGELNAAEKEQFDMYINVDKLLTSMLSLNTVVRLIAKNFDKSISRSYQIVNEAITIFGDPFESFKKGQKRVMYENFMLVAKKCLDNGKEETALSALEKASKLLGLYEAEPEEDIAKLMTIKNRFTTNKKVLEAKQQGVFDVEFEEVGEEGKDE